METKPTRMTWKERYREAHRQQQDREYPATVRDFGYLKPNYPDVSKHGGLLTFIENFLKWSGHNARRITTAGRLIDKQEKQPSGAVITVKKMIKSSTRKGTGDISATVLGKSCWFDGKVGYDKPSPNQLIEQAKERAAGGVYEFIHAPEELLSWYDNFVSSEQQTTLL